MNHMWSIIRYFTVWGLIYGVIIGTLTGTSAWISGFITGGILGSIFGVLIGFGIGLLTIIIHTLTFHQDIDLIMYKRRIAAFNGCLVFIGGLYGLTMLITAILQYPFRNYSPEDFYPLLASFIPKTAVLTALCVAYISSYYPDWIVRTFYTPNPSQPETSPVQEASIRLWKHFFRPIPLTVGMIIVIIFGTTEKFLTYHSSVDILDVINGVMASPIIFLGLTLYLSFGNAVLITFLRRLVFDDGLIKPPTYRYQLMITVISFFFTILMTNWYWTLSPFYVYIFQFFFPTSMTDHAMGKIMPFLIGLLVAYHVYQTLAQPSDDKAKRKETISQTT